MVVSSGRKVAKRANDPPTVKTQLMVLVHCRLHHARCLSPITTAAALAAGSVTKLH